MHICRQQPPTLRSFKGSSIYANTAVYTLDCDWGAETTKFVRTQWDMSDDTQTPSPIHIWPRQIVWFASEVVHYVKNNIIYTHKTLDTHGLCVEEYARKLYSWGCTPADVDCAPMLQYYANSCVKRWDEAYDHEGGADFDVFDDDEDVDDDYIEWKLFKTLNMFRSDVDNVIEVNSHMRHFWIANVLWGYNVVH